MAGKRLWHGESVILWPLLCAHLPCVCWWGQPPAACSSRPPHRPSDKGGCQACCARCASPFTESADSHTRLSCQPRRVQAAVWGPGPRVPEGRPGCSPLPGPFL